MKKIKTKEIESKKKTYDKLYVSGSPFGYVGCYGWYHLKKVSTVSLSLGDSSQLDLIKYNVWERTNGLIFTFKTCDTSIYNKDGRWFLSIISTGEIIDIKDGDCPFGQWGSVYVSKEKIPSIWEKLKLSKIIC